MLNEGKEETTDNRYKEFHPHRDEGEDVRVRLRGESVSARVEKATSHEGHEKAKNGKDDYGWYQQPILQVLEFGFFFHKRIIQENPVLRTGLLLNPRLFPRLGDFLGESLALVALGAVGRELVRLGVPLALEGKFLA